MPNADAPPPQKPHFMGLDLYDLQWITTRLLVAWPLSLCATGLVLYLTSRI